MNFGNAGAKTIFEMTNEQQRNLLAVVHNPDQFSSSMLELLVEVKRKEENRNKMLDLINNVFGELKVSSDARVVLINALNDGIINYNEFVELVCKLALQQQSDAAINELSNALANATFKIKSVAVIENKLLDPSLVNFLKKALWRILHFATQLDVNHSEESFVIFSSICHD